MSDNKSDQPTRRLRAIIEIDPAGGEPVLYPIAGSDADRAAILDWLRIYFGKDEDPGL